MNWGAIRPVLLGLASTLTGISDADAIQWRGSAPAGSWRRGPRISMSIGSIRGSGRDEERRGDEVLISGQRAFTWSMNFESLASGDADVAMTYADRVRAGLRLQSSRDALLAVGLSMESIEATQVLEFNSQDKPFTTAIMDVQLNAVENFKDESEGASDRIERVHVFSEDLIGENGEPTSQQFDEEITSEDFDA